MSSIFTRALKPEGFELIASRFQILADPVRLRILHRLHDREMNVGELAGALEVGQPSISKHLKILLDAGFVARRHEGTATYYHVAEPRIFELCEVVCSTLESRIREQVDAAMRVLGSGPDDMNASRNGKHS